MSQLVNHGNLDFLVLDYLSEITMSLLVGAQRKSKDLGWCPDFAHSVGPHLKQIKNKGMLLSCILPPKSLNLFQ